MSTKNNSKPWLAFLSFFRPQEVQKKHLVSYSFIRCLKEIDKEEKLTLNRILPVGSVMLSWAFNIIMRNIAFHHLIRQFGIDWIEKVIHSTINAKGAFNKYKRLVMELES